MKNFLFILILSLLTAASLTSCGGGGSGGGGTAPSPAASTAGDCGVPGKRCTGTAGGMDYILYVPANFQANSSALVVALHPRYTSGTRMEDLTGLNAKADQAGFAMLYPSTPAQRQWGWFFKSDDDSQSLRTIIATVQATLKADPKRIYVTGFSDGAEMANRVGVDLSDIVAAIAPVSGVLYEGAPPAVMPLAKNGVSVLILQGDVVPFQAFYVCGYPGGGASPPPSADVAFDYWAGPSANNCASLDTTEKICSNFLPVLAAKQAKNCKGTAEVQFYQLLKGSHGWHDRPGNWSVPMNVVDSLNPYNPNFNASTGVTTNDIIWNFFVAHPKP